MALSITLTYARSLFGEVALRSNDREGRLFFFPSGVIHLQIHPFALGIRVLCQLLAETLILEQGDHIGRIAGAALGPQLFQQRAERLGKVVAPTDIIGGGIQRVCHTQRIHDSLDLRRAGGYIIGISALAVVIAVVIERRQGQRSSAAHSIQNVSAGPWVALDAEKLLIQQAADLEIYVNGTALKQAQGANAIVDTMSATVIKKHNPGMSDTQLRQLITAHIDEDEFCRYVIQRDINGIALALRETHKDDFFSVPEDNPLKEMLETAGEIVSQDSDTEQAYLAFICKRLKLNFRKLSVEERKWLKKIAEKSDLLKNPKPQRGRR